MSYLEENYQEIRKFKHDYKNILITIEAFLNNDDIEGLKKYYFKNLSKTDTIDDFTQFTDLKNINKYDSQKHIC